jgi:hypothetical protein
MVAKKKTRKSLGKTQRWKKTSNGHTKPKVKREKPYVRMRDEAKGFIDWILSGA